MESPNTSNTQHRSSTDRHSTSRRSTVEAVGRLAVETEAAQSAMRHGHSKDAAAMIAPALDGIEESPDAQRLAARTQPGLLGEALETQGDADAASRTEAAGEHHRSAGQDDAAETTSAPVPERPMAVKNADDFWRGEIALEATAQDRAGGRSDAEAPAEGEVVKSRRILKASV